ncbi:hypothetical protein QMK33_19340 [Hymenobacter sp. H14-R3]|uniref:hypothetical protein n=1 Tax=Hymenobacter sp. H14-R3 TaxID=3046308 RepID=UPI0024B9F298|nr:hypothetical protein [Hymenobacter sp. H14-R3]MDJ0367308.1 hypothetical protein [Hymenobacter sp. H14-R3]
MGKQQQAERLVDDIHHLGHELSKLIHQQYAIPQDSPTWDQTRRAWDELHETFSSKERQLLAISPRVPLAGALAFAEASWTIAEQELLREGVLPLYPAPPSAVGGARYVVEVPVGHYMLEAFFAAMADKGGAVVSTRPSLGCMGHIYSTTYYTISLESGDDQFELGLLMALHYYATKTERGALYRA